MVRAEGFLCTLHNTADFAVITNVKPKLILVDEAGKALESNVWAILAEYKNVDGRTFLGDGLQLIQL
jgi:hypothetical protein